MYLRNSWYVAGISSEIATELTPLRILDENIVFISYQERRARCSGRFLARIDDYHYLKVVY